MIPDDPHGIIFYDGLNFVSILVKIIINSHEGYPFYIEAFSVFFPVINLQGKEDSKHDQKDFSNGKKDEFFDGWVFENRNFVGSKDDRHGAVF